MAVTHQDVAVMSGLRVNDPLVTSTALQAWEDLCEELLGDMPDDIRGGTDSSGLVISALPPHQGVKSQSCIKLVLSYSIQYGYPRVMHRR